MRLQDKVARVARVEGVRGKMGGGELLKLSFSLLPPPDQAMSVMGDGGIWCIV